MCLIGSIVIMLHHNNIYLHEISLHADHSPADFKPPYQVEHLRLSDAQPTTATCIDPITECINSAHFLVDTFLGMDIDALQAIPVFTYVRVSYALFVLAKLHVSASTSSSKLGDYIDRKSLKLSLYLDATVTCLGKVVEQKGCKVPSMFLRLLMKFQTWCRNQEAQPETAKENDKIIVKTRDPDLPTHRNQTESTGSLNTSEYMLAGSYPSATAFQNLRKQRHAAIAQQVPQGFSNWNIQLQVPFQSTNSNSGDVNSLEESVDPNAAVFTNSVNPSVGQFRMTDEFQYTSAAAFDDQMDLDLDFFSLFGETSNTSGGLGEWVLPASHVGDMTNEQMPKNGDSQFEA